jgi:hypothetical protein
MEFYAAVSDFINGVRAHRKSPILNIFGKKDVVVEEKSLDVVETPSAVVEQVVEQKVSEPVVQQQEQLQDQPKKVEESVSVTEQVGSVLSESPVVGNWVSAVAKIRFRKGIFVEQYKDLSEEDFIKLVEELYNNSKTLQERYKLETVLERAKLLKEKGLPVTRLTLSYDISNLQKKVEQLLGLGLPVTATTIRRSIEFTQSAVNKKSLEQSSETPVSLPKQETISETPSVPEVEPTKPTPTLETEQPLNVTFEIPEKRKERIVKTYRELLYGGIRSVNFFKLIFSFNMDLITLWPLIGKWREEKSYDAIGAHKRFTELYLLKEIKLLSREEEKRVGIPSKILQLRRLGKELNRLKTELFNLSEKEGSSEWLKIQNELAKKSEEYKKLEEEIKAKMGLIKPKSAQDEIPEDKSKPKKNSK